MIVRAVLALVLLTGTASAQDFRLPKHQSSGHWYETRCCSGMDCQPAPIGSVELMNNGWFVRRGLRNPAGAVLQNNDFIAFDDGRIKPLPPQAPRGTGMHICSNSQRVICVYVDSGF